MAGKGLYGNNIQTILHSTLKMTFIDFIVQVFTHHCIIINSQPFLFFFLKKPLTLNV